jgi:hypothetical protein
MGIEAMASPVTTNCKWPPPIQVLVKRIVTEDINNYNK